MPKYPINTGAWPNPDWNLDPKHDRSVPTNIDPGHDKVSPAELKRIKDSFPKHKPTGWICPACERGNAPWAAKCWHCWVRAGE